VNFNLQPDNATNTWLYSEAIKDAHTRALQAAAAAGAKLGAVKVIDPTGRACETDILAHQRSYDDDGMSPQYAVIPPPVVDAAPPPPIPVSPVPGSAEALEAKALQNPFIQTPPIRRLESKACVVYALE
jgi:hypothetical protein